MRKSLDSRKNISYIRNIKTIIRNHIATIQKKELTMAENFITKSVPREKAELLPELQKAYSEKLGVRIGQGDAIGLAIENEYKRLKK